MCFAIDIVVDNCAICRNHIMDHCKIICFAAFTISHVVTFNILRILSESFRIFKLFIFVFKYQ